MANNIEWSHASYLPTAVDPEDIPSTYGGLDEGEVGAWMGSDGANILYGTPEQMAEFGRRLIDISKHTEPAGPVVDEPLQPGVGR